MARATSKAGIGQGWHKQSLRHSNARKTGHAGGSYASIVIHKNSEGRMVGWNHATKDNHYWNFPNGEPAPNNYVWDGTGWIRNPSTYKKFKGFKDSDGDGVPDKDDCQPFNPHAQGTNAQVISAFAQGKKDSSGSITSKGNTIYSYTTPIAFRGQDGTIYFNNTKYSVTTSKQQNQIKRELSGEKIEFVTEVELREKMNAGEREIQEKERDFQKEDPILPNKVIDISEIERRNEKAGHYFFEPASKRFFDSKVARNAYVDKKGDYAYFVTSERFRGDGYSQPRMFTVRKANLHTGHVNTVGDFNKITDSLTATKEAKRLAQEE